MIVITCMSKDTSYLHCIDCTKLYIICSTSQLFAVHQRKCTYTNVQMFSLYSTWLAKNISIYVCKIILFASCMFIDKLSYLISTECGEPDIANGTLTPKETFHVNDTANATCNSGYRIQGQENEVTLQTLICESSGTWNTTSVVCEPKGNKPLVKSNCLIFVIWKVDVFTIFNTDYSISRW